MTPNESRIVMMAYVLPVSVRVSADRNWSSWKAGYFPAVAGAIGEDCSAPG